MTLTSSPQCQGPAPIECEAAVRRLWDYLDGRLPVLALDEVRAHLAVCSLCAPRFAFARAMKDALGELGGPEPLAQLNTEGRSALTARIREALRHAEAHGSFLRGMPNGDEV